MSSTADKMLRDGSVSFEGGQDAGRSPSIIKRNQVSAATNSSMRGGFLSPRPAFVQFGAHGSDATVETAFRTGRFQHAAFFNGTGTPMLLSSHGGRQFKVDINSRRITEITPQSAKTTLTTNDFLVPAVGVDIIVYVANTYYLTPTIASGLAIDDVPLTIDGVDFKLKSVLSLTAITVETTVAASVGTTITSGSSVEWIYADTNSALKETGWSVQAENHWIYQDNHSLPIIFNGSDSRRSIPADNEVPVGNVMAYSMGRLVVALTNRTSFRIGDLVWGAGSRSDMLHFTENDFLNEGGDFIVPSGYGPITAIKSLSMMDTQLGQGPLMVGTPGVICTLNLPFDRTTWKNLTNPIQTITPVLGPTAQDSTVNINTDIWYRGTDNGIHSFIQARRDFTTWGNTPQSTELGKTLEHDSAWMLDRGSSVFFDNRLLETCSPTDSSMGVWHRGLVALDFNLISSMQGKTAPAWEGIWSGLRILKIVTGLVSGKQRCFIYALDDAKEISVWEIDSGATLDNFVTPITWTANFPSYNFTDGFSLKKLESGELFVDRVRGVVEITMKFRADQHPCWHLWDTFSFCGKITDCGPFATCAGPMTSLREQFRGKLKLHQPLDTWDDINDRLYRTGYEFQPRIEVTGFCQLRQIRILAVPMPETVNAERPLVC